MCCPNCCTNKPKQSVVYNINTTTTDEAVREIKRQGYAGR